jgi:hypothetical protein
MNFKIDFGVELEWILSINFPSAFFNELSAVYLALESDIPPSRLGPATQSRSAVCNCRALKRLRGVRIAHRQYISGAGGHSYFAFFARQLDLNMSMSGDIIATIIDSPVHPSIVSDTFDSFQPFIA